MLPDAPSFADGDLQDFQIRINCHWPKCSRMIEKRPPVGGLTEPFAERQKNVQEDYRHDRRCGAFGPGPDGLRCNSGRRRPVRGGWRVRRQPALRNSAHADPAAACGRVRGKTAGYEVKVLPEDAKTDACDHCVLYGLMLNEKRDGVKAFVFQSFKNGQPELAANAPVENNQVNLQQVAQYAVEFAAALKKNGRPVIPFSGRTATSGRLAGLPDVCFG